MSSSAIISARGAAGQGRITVSNGTPYDAVVLIEGLGQASVREAIYIRAGEQGRIDNVGPIRARLRFALGFGWNQAHKCFARPGGASVFDQTLDFTAPAGEAPEWTATLNPVSNGNATTSPISADSFRSLLVQSSPSGTAQ